MRCILKMLTGANRPTEINPTAVLDIGPDFNLENQQFGTRRDRCIQGNANKRQCNLDSAQVWRLLSKCFDLQFCRHCGVFNYVRDVGTHLRSFFSLHANTLSNLHT